MLNLISPRFSFIQFGESSTVQSCNFSPIHLCLPVYDDMDVTFQFVIQTETEEEADALCDLTNDLVEVGITDDCDAFLLNFKTSGYKPKRYRLSPTEILYNWDHGVPGFSSVISISECFVIRVVIGEQSWCSNCLQRIHDTCHTSVIEYSNEENAFDFDYCSDSITGGGEDACCAPLIISFRNRATLVIPYTAELKDKYGDAPTVQVWIYDESGDLANFGISEVYDDIPPTELRFDFGGNSSGIIKII